MPWPRQRVDCSGEPKLVEGGDVQFGWCCYAIGLIMGTGPSIALLVILGICLLARGASAEVAHTKRLRCIACHAGPDRFVEDPETGKITSVTIRMGDYQAGDHAKTHCLNCHTEGFEQFPHFHMKTYTCMDCHPRKDKGAEDDKPYDFQRIREEYEDTVHFTEYKHKEEKCCGTAPKLPTAGKVKDDGKGNERFTCEHCHNPHYFKATAGIKLPQAILKNDNEPCLRCHEDAAKGPLADPAEPSMVAAHAYLPHVDLHLRSTRCADCHSSVWMTVTHDLPKGKGADQGCNSCHSVNTVLADRLYRYVTDLERTLGFRNAKMLRDNYTMGANRHRWADWATYVLIGLSILGILVHGGLRIFYRWRRRWSKESQGKAREVGVGR